MRFRLHELCLTTVFGVAVAVAGGRPAFAGPALDDDKAAPTPTSTLVDPATVAPKTAPADKVEYGVGVRIRNVRAPKGLLELFIESAPGGSSELGLGVDLTRRRGNVEIQLGIEYEAIQPAEGVWIQSNTDVAAGDEADYIVGPDHNNGKSLRWLTFEFTFLNHAPLNKHFAIRYGAGAGIGVVLGELGRYDVFCNGATNESPEPGCVPAAFNGAASPGEGGDQIVKYNLPPVFPVVNVILGVQIRPIPKMTINIEGGIRTFPFFGVSGGYFF